VVYSSEFLYHNRLDSSFQLFFNVWICHFFFPTYAFTIILNNNVWQSSFGNILVLLTCISEKEFTLRKIVLGEYPSYRPNLLRSPPRSQVEYSCTLSLPCLNLSNAIAYWNRGGKVVNSKQAFTTLDELDNSLPGEAYPISMSQDRSFSEYQDPHGTKTIDARELGVVPFGGSFRCVGIEVQASQVLAQPRTTALFLLNPSAYEPREVASLRGIFSNQVD